MTQCVVPEKNHTHPMEGHWKFLVGGGGEVLKAKFLEAMFVQSKKSSMGQLVGIFSGTAQYLI